MSPLVHSLAQATRLKPVEETTLSRFTRIPLSPLLMSPLSQIINPQGATAKEPVAALWLGDKIKSAQQR